MALVDQRSQVGQGPLLEQRIEDAPVGTVPSDQQHSRHQRSRGRGRAVVYPRASRPTNDHGVRIACSTRCPHRSPRTRRRPPPSAPASGATRSAAHDRDTLYEILDEGLICHLAYAEDGSPRAIPTIHARVGDTLYLHGSAASRTMRAIKQGIEVCVVITLVDGLVLARSAFSHSVNYRSAVVYGRAREVTDLEEQLRAARALADHVVPGRAGHIREPNEDELRQTTLLALPLEEASAKVRTGPPKDDPADLELPTWAGVLPLRTVADPPIDDPHLRSGIMPPANVTHYRRPGR